MEEIPSPSIYTKLYWLVQDDKVDPQVFLDLAELYWPTFIKKNEYVFLKNKFEEKYYTQLLTDKHDPEYWINLITVDDFFTDLDNWELQSITLSKLLKEIWDAKLRTEFPSQNFIVEYLHDEEVGDYGVTFYQKKNSC